ncbi:MAG TPA: phosphatase PAP2 family protein [bacterium]|nr:phosphatase PAP2 family protein [bacterium]HQI49784.1 phosphatase PAP2 family protein [bacterium]HQJ63183.1 phosphatase PAP2 family protein [bacterium]
MPRDRPCAIDPAKRYHIKSPDPFSFPSGHTAAAFLMATLISFFWLSAVLAAFGWASLTGFSRV